MEYAESRGDNWVCIKMLATKLSAANAGEFRSALRSTIGDGEQDVILDLSDVRFMDSTALGAVAASLQLLKPDFHLYFCTTTETILSVLRLMRLDRVFRVVGDPATAVTLILQDRESRSNATTD